LKAKLPQQWHMWRHNAYLLGQSGYFKKEKDLEIKCKPHTMAQVEAQCLSFDQDGCKNKEQENKSTLLQYQIFM
jgi:hypothetical protein